MTGLYLVREEAVPVEELRPGDTLILPGARRVTVERIDEYEDGTFVVRWWRPAERGEPGHRNLTKNSQADGCAMDGRLLGSLIPVPAGHCWKVARG